jgi:dTDP-4-amino-4,6-dideoxygalactose transaminase
VWHLFPLLVRGDRTQLQEHLRRAGVATGVHYPRVIPEQAALRRYGRFEVLGPLARAQAFAASELSIPIHPFLSAAEVQHIIDACNAWSG